MRYKVSDPEGQVGQTDLTTQPSNATWQCNRDAKKSRSKESILILVAGLLAVAVIALVATLILQMVIFAKEEYKEMCQSEECVNTAARVIQSMDRSFEPCDDFYRFACGGWTKNHPIPQSQTSWDQLSLLREELMSDLRLLLEEPDREDDLRPVKLARSLYRTCMDIGDIEFIQCILHGWKISQQISLPLASVEKMGLEPIFGVLSRLGLPREPPLGNDVKRLNLARLAGVVQRLLGLNLFVNFYINEDVRNTTRNRMTMEQVSPGFSERYLLEPLRFQSELTEYRKYITSMMELAGAGNESAAFANELIEFTTEIAKIVTSPEERRSVNHLFHDITITELQRLTDLNAQQWNWTIYLEAIFNNTNVTIDTSVDRVIVMDLQYLQKLPSLLANTSSATLARYAWWGVFSTVAPLTLQKFRDLGFEFSQKLFGLKEKTARWKGCTGNVNSNFGMALTYLYVQRHFNEHSREKALEMLSDIKEAFNDMVTELDWMDAGTRARAHQKLSAIRPFVGFPEWITDPEKLNKFYDGAEVVDGKLLETFLKLTNTGVQKSLNSLREKPDKNRWISTGTTVNAFYSAVLNSVTFPAGILHPPFYGNGIESINYGAMGAIMGHELTHGFDDQGRRYDENGNLRQWWSDETLIHYHEKVECIIKQYSSYHVPELGHNFTVNGLNTQGENIADNGGIREAYRAYKRLTMRNPGHQQALPGLTEYTHDQLFFLGFSQVWCGNYTNGALKSKLIEGVHAPNHFRVIGTLSNNAEFARAWNCPAGSPMNPNHKCILW